MNTNIITINNDTIVRNYLNAVAGYNAITEAEDKSMIFTTKDGQSMSIDYSTDDPKPVNDLLIATLCQKRSDVRKGIKLYNGIYGTTLGESWNLSIDSMNPMNTISVILLATMFNDCRGTLKAGKMHKGVIKNMSVEDFLALFGLDGSAINSHDTKTLIEHIFDADSEGDLKSATLEDLRDMPMSKLMDTFNKTCCSLTGLKVRVPKHNVPVVKANISAVEVKLIETPCVDKTGAPLMYADKVTPVTEFKVDTNVPAIMNMVHYSVRHLDQKSNNLFRVLDDFYTEWDMADELEEKETLVFMSMETDYKNEQFISSKIAEFEANGDTNNPKYNEYKHMLAIMKNPDIKKAVEEATGSGVLSIGFMMNGMHYTYLLSTQAQYRAGIGMFAADPHDWGFKLNAAFMAKLVGIKNYKDLVKQTNGMEEKEAANFIFKAIQEQVPQFNRGKIKDKNGNEYLNMNVRLSKVLGRPGLAASSGTSLEDMVKIAPTETKCRAFNMLSNMKAKVVKDAEIMVETEAKSLMIDKITKNKIDKYMARITKKSRKTIKQTVADGGGLMSYMAAVCISHIMGILDAEQFIYFVAHYVGDYDTETSEVKDIIDKAVNGIQTRFTENIRGWKCMLETSGLKEKKLTFLDGIDFIVPASCVKYNAEGAVFNASNLIICHADKMGDFTDNMSRMSAQYVANLTNWTSENAIIASNMVMANHIAAAGDSYNTKSNGKAIKQAMDNAVRLGIVGKSNGVSMFNQGVELVKANRIMRTDKHFLEYMRGQMASAIWDTAIGRIPVHGDYLFLGFDDNEAINAWFRDEFKANGINPLTTLKDIAKELGIDAAVAYCNDYDGEMLMNRSPANMDFEAQVLQGVGKETVKTIGKTFGKSDEEINELLRALEGYSHIKNIIIVTAADGTARKAGGADHDGDHVLVIFDNTEMNKLIIRGVDRKAIEVIIDPDEIKKIMKDKLMKDMALTVDNSIFILSKNLHRSNIGKISKYSMAFAAFKSHMNEVIRLMKLNKCNNACFVVPCVKNMGWVASSGDPSLTDYDEKHNTAVDFLSGKLKKNEGKDVIKEKQDIIETHGNGADKNFKGYAVRNNILYVEGYVEFRYDEETKDYVPAKDDKGDYIGFYGNKKLKDIQNMRDMCDMFNRINGAAQGIEIDSTNNGFGSFFHVVANFMGIHELFRDFLKGKKPNLALIKGAYLNIGALGALFINTMAQWDDVMSKLDLSKAVDNTAYISMLLNDDEANSLICNQAANIALHKCYTEYVEEMTRINESYTEDEEEERMDDIASLTYNTQNHLYSIIDTFDDVSIHALALACWTLGNGKSFSFILGDELIELLENDPTAYGIERLPKNFADDMGAGIKVINGYNWLTTYRFDSGLWFERMVCKVNGKNVSSKRAFTSVMSDTMGNHYAIFKRTADDTSDPKSRTRTINMDLVKGYTFNLFGCKFDFINGTQELRAYADDVLTDIYHKQYPGYIVLNVFMDSDNVMKWTKTVNGKVYTGCLEIGKSLKSPLWAKEIAKGSLNGRTVIFKVSSAVEGKNSYTNLIFHNLMKA